MSIHGGSPKTDGYQEEHGAGLIGCVTGNSYHYSKNDSYYAYTDHESIDIAIANHYKTVPALAALPFASLHIGAGAHSDADNVGLGPALHLVPQARRPGDSQYGNAIEPVQDAGQVYDTLMQRVNADLRRGTRTSRPPTTRSCAPRSQRKKSLIDFRLADIADAKRVLGMDSRARAASSTAWSTAGARSRSATQRRARRRSTRAARRGRRAWPARRSTRPTGNGDEQAQLRSSCRRCTTR